MTATTETETVRTGSCPLWCVDHQDDTSPTASVGQCWHYSASQPWSDRPGFSVRLEQFQTDEKVWGVELSIRGVDVDGMREDFAAPVTHAELLRLATAILEAALRLADEATG